jgi:hypothetical protein
VFWALVCGRLLAGVLDAAAEYGNLCVRRGRAGEEGFPAVRVLNSGAYLVDRTIHVDVVPGRRSLDVRLGY